MGGRACPWNSDDILLHIADLYGQFGGSGHKYLQYDRDRFSRDANRNRRSRCPLLLVRRNWFFDADIDCRHPVLAFDCGNNRRCAPVLGLGIWFWWGWELFL